MSSPGPTEALLLASPLLGRQAALAAADPTRDYEAYPEELAAIPGAVDRRRREFAAGRTAARLALRELGAPAMAVPMGADRAPIWPPGLLGSITHTGTACLAAVAWEGELRLLGLDLEEDTPLDPDLIPTVCSPAERAWLAGQDDPGHWAKLIFSAKECAYKAQYPISRTLFGFDALRIALDTGSRRFSATFRSDMPGFRRGHVLHGRYAAGEGLIVTAIAEPA
ncbi:4'-phosphopantetheinyl transferase family protein [Ruegeria marina]|uniref:Enterobactin synthase component D n=1 Tax=Ruegeria marina TaxID=639004 RepID=A0A1G6T5Q3_9RHOB|nr:4'-phosphopantetheinyl transferase superfamily protein [Ruegeria marina]SDD24331.1 4'-phosphopantetheinyl transferase EntD (siderophore biosynthesis) [Ruegeria marina]